MSANVSSTDAVVVVTDSLAPVTKSKPSPVSVSGSGSIALQSDERDVWLAILKNWKAQATAAGLRIEVYDARPHESAFVVIVNGASYHADCDIFSRGNVCHACGKDVVTDTLVTTNPSEPKTDRPS